MEKSEQEENASKNKEQIEDDLKDGEKVESDEPKTDTITTESNSSSEAFKEDLKDL